jgi:hypothetical protein
VALMALLVAAAATTHANAPPIHYRTATAADVRPISECRRYYRAVCNNWRIAEWLPSVIADGFEPWRQNKASSIDFTDGFLSYPQGGTPFVYGESGPPRGTAVYDYTHAIAFYSQGCCAWHETVLAARVKAPPMRVADRNLRYVHTVHGIALGDTFKHVEALYGSAVPQSIPREPGMTLLSYVHMTGKTCGQFQNFAFLRNRLVYIELLNGC